MNWFKSKAKTEAKIDQNEVRAAPQVPPRPRRRDNQHNAKPRKNDNQPDAGPDAGPDEYEVRLMQNRHVSLLDSLERCTSGETNRMVRVKSLPRGGEARIWLLRREKDQKLIVCKAIPHGRYSQATPYEVRVLQGLLPAHDRIIRLRDWFSGPKSTQMYFDFFDGGDLEQLSYQYYRRRARFPESFLWHVFLQLTEAVAFIHYGYDVRRGRKQPAKWQRIIHRDIKPQNIFLRLPLSYPGRGLYPHLVLADFGLASLKDTSDRLVGTPEFQPPELPLATRKADVWAIGAVMHSLIFDGQPPLAPKPAGCLQDDWACDPAARQPKIITGQYSVDLAYCLYQALTPDPDERVNSIRLLNAILDSEGRQACMKKDWKPLGDWAFSQDPRENPKSNKNLSKVSSRDSDLRILLD